MVAGFRKDRSGLERDRPGLRGQRPDTQRLRHRPHRPPQSQSRYGVLCRVSVMKKNRFQLKTRLASEFFNNFEMLRQNMI